MLVAGAGDGAGAAGLLRAGARRAVERRLARPSCRRSTSRSATPCRCSTSARPPAASTARRRACARRSRAGARCRSSAARGAGRAARARGRAAERRAGLRRRDPRRPADLHARVRRAVGAQRARAARGRAAAQPRAGRRAASGSARDGAEPFYRGDVAAAVCEWLARPRRLAQRREDLAGYRAIEREPVRDRATATARSSPTRRRRRAARCWPTRSALLDRGPRAADAAAVSSTAMAAAQSERTPEFVEGLVQDRASWSASWPAGSGSTTHISVIDADGRACSATCTNGEGSGVVVPGTGMHLNNVMGEEDLNPLGFHLHPAGRRMPSMMAPVGRDARRRGRAGAGQRRLQPHPLGAPADDRRRRRPRAGRARGGRRSAGALRGRRRLRRARDRPGAGRSTRTARSSASAR